MVLKTIHNFASFRIRRNDYAPEATVNHKRKAFYASIVFSCTLVMETGSVYTA